MSLPEVAAAVSAVLPVRSLALPYVLTGVKRVSPVTQRYSTTNQPADWSPQIRAGSAQWNNQGAAFEFLWGENTTAGPTTCTTGATDGINVHGWHPLGSGILGMACWTANGQECDIAYSLAFSWANMDIQSVAAHEAGHCLGMGHSADPSALMYYALNGVKHAILPDDLAGLCAIYGCDVLPTPTPPSTPVSTMTPTPAGTLSPTPTEGPTPTEEPTATPTNTPTPGWTPTSGPAVTPTPTPLPLYRQWVPNVARDGP